MAADVVLEETADGVRLLTLNRPERMNAWTVRMEDRYFDRLLESDADPDVRAIVVTGAGRAFSTGADIGVDVAVEGDPRTLGSLDRRPTTLPLTIRKPIIGAINGSIAGVSLAQALQFDVRFAAPAVKMTFAFTQRGLAAEHCATWLLPRLVGTGRAMDLLLSGRVFAAEEALAIGLVNRVVPADELIHDALAYARALVEQCSPASMALVKYQVHADAEADIETSRRRCAMLAEAAIAGPDFREGIKAFLQKRPPAFPALGQGTAIPLPEQTGHR